jgi:hypothetical protein
MRFGLPAILALCLFGILFIELNFFDLPARPSAPTTRRAKVKHPAWELPPAEKRALFDGAARLKAGDTYDHVIDTLGKPTYDRQAVAKGSTTPRGRSLRYQALVWEEGLVNELHDEWVMVVLDTHNIVVEVKVKQPAAQ